MVTVRGDAGARGRRGDRFVTRYACISTHLGRSPVDAGTGVRTGHRIGRRPHRVRLRIFAGHGVSGVSKPVDRGLRPADGSGNHAAPPKRAQLPSARASASADRPVQHSDSKP